MAKNVRIGTCGFRNTKQSYAEVLSTVEIQHTFYQPPQIKTLEKWRSEMPEGFEFTLKAWQFITHESSSPTFKRLKRPLTDQETDEAGFFRDNETVDEAYKVTLDCAEALGARTVLFQCPAKFQPTPENILNLKKFFSTKDRRGRNFVWEPRGKWEDQVIKELCEELDLWHCVDPFARPTLTPQNCYYRLHGIPRWRYTYEDEELFELASLLPDERLSYVFFNNITMRNDAVRFSRVIEDMV